MYATSDGTKVTIVAHRMGGLVSLHFLTGYEGIDQDWKDKYIHAYITLSAVWGGSVPSLQVAISAAHGVPNSLFLLD